MKLRAEGFDFFQAADKLIRGDHRLKRAQADAGDARHLIDCPEGIQQALAIKVTPVTGQVDACQHHLAITRSSQPLSFKLYI